MAIFHTDQVRQFYIPLAKAEAALTDASPVGALRLNSNAEDVWFEYMSPNGGYNGGAGPVRSDLIHKGCIDYIKITPAKPRKLKRLVVSLNPDINNGDPVVGQEYILRFRFYGLGVGGNDIQLPFFGGSYRVQEGDTGAEVMTALKAMIDLNTQRNPNPYITATVSGNTLVIEESLQPWVRGKKEGAQVNFTVETPMVLYNGGYFNWGQVEDTTATNDNEIGNGRIVADMEWFYLGERGDEYRDYGYPMNFDTVYLADSTKQYQFVEIQHYYRGDAEDIQHSKKWLTLAVPTDGAYTAAQLATDLAATNPGVTIQNLL